MDVPTLYWEDVNEGDELPPLVKEVTATTIVAGAVATRDFVPLHHDSALAREQGNEDLFMSILVSGAWAGRFLGDWYRPAGELKKISVKLGATCYPGATLTWTGKVVKKYHEADQLLVDVSYLGRVPKGDHCTGIATIILPSKG